jgi:predicted enzyme related to lactoylglutathione lyase
MSESGAESLAGPPEIMATNAFYYYQDLDSAWSFYTRVLGFRTVADYGFAKMVQVGPTSFLTLVDEGRGMHSAQEPKSVTLAVVTQEVEGWWAYLSEAGVEMRSPLGSEEGRPHDGFVAVDPEGYLLEFERFNEHPENRDLLPVFGNSASLYPDGGETAPGVSSNRPSELGVQGTVLWLYYRDLDAIQDFYGRLLGTGILVDQGWAKVYPVSESGTGFLGFVDGDRGLHGVTEEKAVTVSFFTTDVEAWLAHANQVPGFRLRGPGLTSEEDFVQTFVGFDPEGYYLEWDEFLGVPVNEDLLSLLRSREAQDSR